MRFLNNYVIVIGGRERLEGHVDRGLRPTMIPKYVQTNTAMIHETRNEKRTTGFGAGG